MILYYYHAILASMLVHYLFSLAMK